MSGKAKQRAYGVSGLRDLADMNSLLSPIQHVTASAIVFRTPIDQRLPVSVVAAPSYARGNIPSSLSAGASCIAISVEPATHENIMFEPERLWLLSTNLTAALLSVPDMIEVRDGRTILYRFTAVPMTKCAPRRFSC